MPRNIITASFNLAAAALLILPALSVGPSAELMSVAYPEALFTDVTGSLVIVGGGDLPDRVRMSFLDLAGGKRARLVIIPTASESADQLQTLAGCTFWMSQDVASVEFLHTRNPQQANDPGFVRSLTQATGV